jgi:hypothetical protein
MKILDGILRPLPPFVHSEHNDEREESSHSKEGSINCELRLFTHDITSRVGDNNGQEYQVHVIVIDVNWDLGDGKENQPIKERQ